MCLAGTQLLLGLAFTRLAQAQASAAPKDTVATRYQLPGADCALFPAAARLPDWLPEKRLASHRFTPAAPQVAAAETALAMLQLLHVSQGPKTSQDSTYARNITRRLRQYRRQYFGFYNRRKQPCVFINFVGGDIAFNGEEAGLRPKLPGYPPQWLREYLFIGDGGDNHWSICYNLTTGRFYRYWHNLDLGGG